MTGLNWQTVEHWQIHDPDTDWLFRIRLQVVDDIWVKTWRVDWGRRGHKLSYASFSGPDREKQAREEFERRKAGYKGGGEWERIP